MPTFTVRLRPWLGEKAFDVSRDMSWDEVMKWKERVKGLGGRYEGGGVWVIPLLIMLRNGDVVEGFLRDFAGDEGVRVWKKFRRFLDEQIRKYSDKGYMILFKPWFVEDRDAYRLLRHFKRFASFASGHYMLFSPKSVKELVKHYGSNFSVALERLRRAGIVVIGGPKEVSESLPVIKVSEGDEGEVIFDVSNPMVGEVVSEAVKKAVKEMGGENFSIHYYKRGVDDRGRPTTYVRKYGFARYVKDKDYSGLAVKAALLPKVVEELERRGFKVEGLPAREWGSLSVEFRGPKLRPYQEEAVEKWFKSGKRGLVVLPTGGGKTLVALAVMAKLGLPTLIVVPTVDLAKQWREKIIKVLGLPEDMVGEGKDVKPVTITTYNGLARHWKNYLGKFALVITDETHHTPAETYLRALSRIDAPFRLGLTATPERLDRNTHVIHALTGKEVVRKSPIDLMREGYLAPVKIDYVEVKPNDEEVKEFKELMEKARELRGGKRGATMNKAKEVVQTSRAKDEAIKKIVADVLRDGKRRAIIFCEFIKQAKRIADELRKEFGDVVAELNGKMNKKAREESIKRFREGKARVLVVTPAGNEGLDIPSADTAVFASFKRSEINFIQRVGRVMRPMKDKVSRVYVIYTPYEEDYVEEFKDYVRKYMPQEKVEEVINALASKAKEVLKREATESAEKVKDNDKARVRKKVSLLGKHLPPFIQAILWKPVKALSKEDKIRLIEYVLSVKGTYAFKQDVARSAKRKARYVYTWLKNPSRSDIPGVDTPEGKKILRTALRRLKKKRSKLNKFVTIQ